LFSTLVYLLCFDHQFINHRVDSCPTTSYIRRFHPKKMSSTAELEKQVAALEEENTSKSAQIRVLSSRLGETASKQVLQDQDDLLEKFSALEVSKTLGEKDPMPLEILLAFFQDAKAELREDSAFFRELDAKTSGMSKDQQKERMDAARLAIDGLYVSLWSKYNVSEEAASKAVSESGLLSSSDDLSADQQAELRNAIETFQESEQFVVGSIVLGKDEFAVRVAQRTRFMKVQSDVLDKLNALDGNKVELSKFFQSVQTEASAVQEKIRAMPEEERLAFMDNPSPEDEECMFKMQILQEVQQGGGSGHGHSYGGKPCGKFHRSKHKDLFTGGRSFG